MVATSLPPILCILGPTASGKTATALELARHIPIEIISLDSALIYRGMDIGTAKPTLAERQAVLHHLIDIRDPAQAYSAAQFCTDAWSLIHAIRHRGAIPVLVGGTMLYYRALTQGLHDLPTADPTIRAAIDAEARKEGWPALHHKLAQCDPITAQRLAPNDAQRIGRALEIWRLTGHPLSTLLEAPKPSASLHSPLSAEAASSHFIALALEPSERASWHHKIQQRFTAMLEEGFVDEVRQLSQRADLHPGLPSMRCVGYRQIWAYLKGDVSYDTMCDQALAATRQLGKRQITWLRALQTPHTIDCNDMHAQSKAVELALSLLEIKIENKNIEK